MRAVGFDDVSKTMQKAAAAFTDDRLREIARAGAAPVADHAQRTMPKLTGLTAEDIQVIDEEAPAGVVKVAIGAPRRWWILNFAEFGTSDRAARPVLRPALDAQRGAMSSAINTGIRRLLAPIFGGSL